MMDDAALELDCGAAGALSGPIGFNLDAKAGSYMLLPHLPGLAYYTKMLGGRAMLALHDHDQDAAWTNLLAATRIVTAWQTEPAEVSEYLRFNCLHTVYNLTWQALQAGNWSDSRLARLQESFRDQIVGTDQEPVAGERRERLIWRVAVARRSQRQHLPESRQKLMRSRYHSI